MSNVVPWTKWWRMVLIMPFCLSAIDTPGKRLKMDLPYVNALLFWGQTLKGQGYHFQSSWRRNLIYHQGKWLENRNIAGRRRNSKNGTQHVYFLVCEAMLCSCLFNETVGKNIIGLLIEREETIISIMDIHWVTFKYFPFLSFCLSNRTLYFLLCKLWGLLLVWIPSEANLDKDLSSNSLFGRNTAGGHLRSNEKTHLSLETCS